MTKRKTHLRIRGGQNHEQRRHHREAHVLNRDAAPLVDKGHREPIARHGPDDRDERVADGGLVDDVPHVGRARADAGHFGIREARVPLGQLDRVREARALEHVGQEEVLGVEGDVEQEPFGVVGVGVEGVRGLGFFRLLVAAAAVLFAFFERARAREGTKKTVVFFSFFSFGAKRRHDLK